MPVRASRRAGVDVPYDVMAAIASDPAAFDAKVQDWDNRRNAAVEAEARADKAVAAAKAGQDKLVAESAASEDRLKRAWANLTSDRAEFETLANAANARLMKLESELNNREGDLLARERAVEDREAAVNKTFREAEAMKQAADQAKRLADTNSSIVADLRVNLEAKLDKFRQFGVELQA